MKKYDHIIVGTGQATGTLLGKLIPLGDSIAVIEGAKVGGSCVNYGCTPTKTMVAAAKAIHTARRGAFFGFTTDKVVVDYARVRERMNEVRSASNEGLTEWLEGADNVDLIRAWGVFTGAKTLQVGEQEIEGEKIYINVGTQPFYPPIEGIQEVNALDSAGLLEVEDLPEHLLIIGGGYIGVEFAQVFRRLGSAVTIVQGGHQLMPREDTDVATAIQDFLEEEGIRIWLNSRATKVTENGKEIKLWVEQEGMKATLTGSHLLIATGRRPNSDRLHLEAAGIKTDERGYIQVDNYCRTNVENVFALGDVNGEGAFTHTSVNDAEIVLDFLFGGKRKISMRNTIYGLFTDPPLGRVGMNEKEAIASGKKVLKSVYPMSEISRAKEMGETKGFAKLLVDADNDLILGASILGANGDEIVNMFAAIIHSNIPCNSYRKVVLIHPTISELMPFVLDRLELVEVES
ncbi:MAG: mercuric reductase [Bacteroidota bacterium]